MHIILGSKSPRRSQLLKEIGLNFDILVAETDESYPANMPVAEVPTYIARNKALAIQDQISADTLVITSDTIVTLNGEIFGKPKDAEDAFQMLRKLSGHTHQVITGICMQKGSKIILDSCTTTVTFRELTDDEIHFYIQHYQPFDKAGSYGIQEWIGAAAITSINGSYNNVVGLPTHLIVTYLNNFQ